VTFTEKNPLRKNVLAIAGPTGCGKSELALQLAAEFRGEIVNCDSVQIFRWFDIGSAKLPENERRGIPHHLIDIANPDEVFTAGDFARVGRRALRETADRGHLAIVTGGTGFYLRALVEGLAAGPGRDETLRGRLRDRETRRPGFTHRLLRRLDPATAARIHPNDIPKVIRAVEICISSRRAASAVFAEGRDALEGFHVLKIGLFPDREALYKRLEARMEAMFAAGLIEETRAILARGYSPHAKPFDSIGYKQALQCIEGTLSPKDALFYAKQATRRYAKRQMTWFRQEPGIEICAGFGDDPAVAAKVRERVLGWLAC
jgi:tRNA dimethylallyltransferase